MKFRHALAALLAVCLFGAAAAAREPGAEIVAFGRYANEKSGNPQKAERTASGIVEPATRFRLIERTDLVVGQLGNDFGMELRLLNFPPGDVVLTVRTFHPPITNPETGKTTTVSEYDWRVASDRSFHFSFYFGRTWLIAEGPWTMQIIHRGKILAEKTFKVVVPIN